MTNKRQQLTFQGLESPKELIEGCHYTHTWPSGRSQIYFFEDAIVVFSISANPYIDQWLGCKVWEFSRLWAPDGHRPNLLTEAISHAIGRFKRLRLADALISYADPNVGHTGGVYRAASWTFLGECEEQRGWRSPQGTFIPRRAFHSGPVHMNKADIEELGFVQVKLRGKLRFAKALTAKGRKAIEAKAGRKE